MTANGKDAYVARPEDGISGATARIAITEPLDVFAARRAVVALAATAGFASGPRAELAIVASELATNILKYGVRGTITATVIDDERGRGLELVALDQGPPLHDLAAALRDGWTDRGPVPPGPQRSLGAGLGAIHRLSDVFEYHPGPPMKRFRTIRYVPVQR